MKKIAGACLIAAAVLFVIMLFSSDIDRILTDRIPYTYSLGCSLINYSAGFIRRGLFGELIGLMNGVLQPVLSIMLISALSLIFILYLFLSRMTRLNIKPPYILAILLSPSLILMQRGPNFIHNDAFLIALNLAVSCFLLHLIFHKRHGASDRPSFAMMLLADSSVFAVLTVSALIHELSASLLPPVILLFFIYSRRVHRMMHSVSVLALLILVYALMMIFFKYADPDIIAESWSGIYSDPDSYRKNTALLNIADSWYSSYFLSTAATLFKEHAIVFIPHMFTAVAVPFIILLLSGITVFHSASSRAGIIRGMIVISSVCPLGLCLVGIDYGRWFSISAINLTSYILLTAHPAGRIRSEGNQTENLRKIKDIAKQCTAAAIAVILLNFRLDVDGYFLEAEQTIAEETGEAIFCCSNLPEDLGPVIARDRIIQPKNGAR
ncbi:MAG: hypothetical protein SPL25_03510 [Succinivibrionaceae bacterium]|nr:hypothetical protein [Succinivibrionaceae bacterium]